MTATAEDLEAYARGVVKLLVATRSTSERKPSKMELSLDDAEPGAVALTTAVREAARVGLPVPRRLSPAELAQATEEARDLRARLDARTAGMESVENVRLV